MTILGVMPGSYQGRDRGVAQRISLRKDSSVSGLIIKESNPAVMAFACSSEELWPEAATKRTFRSDSSSANVRPRCRVVVYSRSGPSLGPVRFIQPWAPRQSGR
jgi:hypothetical protein